MKKLVAIAFLLCACTDATAARATLDKEGFTDVEITGWGAFECSDSDTTSTKFKAKNSQGKEVEGVVCCGLILKSCTVRW